VIIVSASGKENVGKENRGFVIFLSYIFLSAGLDGRNDDHGPIPQLPLGGFKKKKSSRCRSDFNHPPTAVGGIQEKSQKTFAQTGIHLHRSKNFGAFGAGFFLIAKHRVPPISAPASVARLRFAPPACLRSLPTKPEAKRVKAPSATCRPSRGGNRESSRDSRARRRGDTPTGN